MTFTLITTISENDRHECRRSPSDTKHIALNDAVIEKIKFHGYFKMATLHRNMFSGSLCHNISQKYTDLQMSTKKPTKICIVTVNLTMHCLQRLSHRHVQHNTTLTGMYMELLCRLLTM